MLNKKLNSLKAATLFVSLAFIGCKTTAQEPVKMVESQKIEISNFNKSIVNLLNKVFFQGKENLKIFYLKQEIFNDLLDSKDNQPSLRKIREIERLIESKIKAFDQRKKLIERAKLDF